MKCETTNTKRDTMNTKLIGKWFHSFQPNGSIQWQGKILDHDDQTCLIQLYNWVDGYPSDQKRVPITDANTWKLYRSNRLMLLAYRQHVKRLKALGAFL